MSHEVPIARLSELPDGSRRVVEVSGRQIAVLSSESRIYAVDNACPHAGAPLACGELRDGLLTCRWHGWQFDLCTGKSPLASFIRVKTYPVVVDGDLVKLVID